MVITHTQLHTMPCAAGSRCTSVPDHTPGPPTFTNHPCKACGKYLHGTCGVVDPLGATEMHRVCHPCEGSRGRETSGAGSAGGQSEKRDSSGGKGKSPAGASSGVKLGQPVAKKPGGAAKRKRVSVEEKVAALDLLATMSFSAVAAEIGTGESTIYGWKKEEKKLRDAAAGAKAGAKSTKGGDFPKVDKAVMELLTQARAHGLPVDRLAIQSFGRKAKASLLAQTSTPAEERERLGGFTASEGWAKKFVSRHALKSKKPHDQREAGQSSAAAAPRPPPYSGVAEHFGELEDTAEKCGMSDMSYHLRKAKLAWMSAYGSRKTKQTCIREFMYSSNGTQQRWC